MTASELGCRPAGPQYLRNVAFSVLGTFSAAMLVVCILFAWIIGFRGLSLLIKTGFGG